MDWSLPVNDYFTIIAAVILAVWIIAAAGSVYVLIGMGCFRKSEDIEPRSKIGSDIYKFS